MAVPTVSVIIPAWNAAAYIDAALDSVMAQTYRDFECIVVDDGSTDGTPGILQRRGDANVLRQTNRGPAAARNAGIAVARGEFLCFLDADNLWFPDRLAVQVGFHREHPDLDYSYVELEERIEPGIEPPSWALSRQPDGGITYRFASCGLMVRRTAMQAIGGFNASFRAGEVAEWLSRARDAGLQQGLIPQVLGAVRIHGANLTYDQQRIRSGVLQALHESIRRKRGIRPGSGPGASGATEGDS